MRNVAENANKGVAPTARGMEIACRFFWEVGLPAIESRFPSDIDRIAAGLVAAGSDCSGNDDETSRDSDWGPRFQTYLTEDDFARIGSDLQSLLDELPRAFDGACCNTFDAHASRVFRIDAFFAENTGNGSNSGFSRAPESPLDWLRIPEWRLFEVTRGQVFYDPLGEFSERRRGFAAYYPGDAWRKRLAAALFESGQSGQDLLPRALARDDYYTAEIAWWSFAQAAMKLGFLLNRRYGPWQKWLYREFCKLPQVAAEITNLLWDGQCEVERRPQLVDRVASVYDARMRELGLVSSSDAQPSLIQRAKEVSASIRDPEIARLAPWVDVVLA